MKKSNKHSRPPPKPVWAYAYQIVAPQPEDLLGTIKSIIDQENTEARRGARSWAGRVVSEEQVTHILVVTDTPEQDREINRRLEAALQRLKAGFSITAPMPLDGDALPEPATG